MGFRSVVVRLVALVAFGSGSIAFAQATNNCASAPLLTSYGSYPFNTKGATTDGAANVLCNGSGNQTIHNDVWYRFRAPETFIVDISTCGLTSLNTKIAVYAGAVCSAPLLACSDDACGTQSRVTFDAVKGQIYLIRVGANVAAGIGSGSISIAPVPVLASATNPATGVRYVVVRPTSTFTWTEAAAYATRLGGYLASIGSQAEQNFIWSSLLGGGFSSLGLWIGLSDRAVEGVFESSDGFAVSYTNWAQGEPNNSAGDEDCAELSAVWGGAWNDKQCGSFGNFAIIEIPSPTFVLDVVSSATNKRYVAWNAPNWTAGERLAVALRGNLVSIGSTVEQAFVQSTLAALPQGGPVWIGLNDRAAEGIFVWTDGTPFSFANWAQGEPNNSAGDEDCVQMIFNGTWNDARCTLAGVALLELPAPTQLPCNADLDGDRNVSSSDLGALLSGWGTAAADLTGDGITDSADLGVLLSAWGACP